MARYPRYWTIVFILVICFSQALAQDNPLDQKVSFSLDKVRLDSALSMLDKLTSLAFAYNPEVIPVKAHITYSAKEKPLQMVLSDLANDGFFSFEVIEKQIVLSSPRKPILFTVSGFLTDEATGEALIGATVIADSSLIGSISNGYGFFSLQLPPGEHRLISSILGYENISTPISLFENKQLRIQLIPSVAQLQEVVIRADETMQINLIQTGKAIISSKMISEAPVAFGEYDVIKSLEYLPGITLQSEGSTFFFVRGGNKDQNLILIDDAPIYNPTHMLGLFSSIMPGSSTSIEVYKSDFPLAKRGRLSSVIDIKTREGNTTKLGGWGNIGLISTQLGISGPIQKEKSSFLISGRMSRLKWFFKQQFNDLEQFRFYDLTAKVNNQINDRNRLFASFYTSADNFLTNITGLGWRNLSGSLRWNHLKSDKIFINNVLYGSNYAYELHTDRTQGQLWHSRIGELGLKSDLSWYISNKQELAIGLNVIGRTINPGNLVSRDSVPANYVVSVKNNLETALYGEHKLDLTDHIGLKYGVRASVFTSLGDAFEFQYDSNGQPVDTTNYNPGQPYNSYVRAEPLLTLQYKLSKASLKASYTHTVQNLHLISNTISPFTSFEVWLPSGPEIKPQSADQVVLGFDRLFSNWGVLVQVEAYYKWLHHQLDYKEHAGTLLNPHFASELVFGSSQAYGAELTIKKEEGRLRGLAGYSYGRVRSKFSEIDDGMAFDANTDRPHHANINLNWDATRRITLGANFVYTSGQPFSSPTAFYQFNNTEIPVYGKKNNDRFPDLHRLDLSAKFKLNKNPDNRFQHSLTFGIYNVYGRKNPIFINFNKTLNENQTLVVPADLLDVQRVASRTYLYRVMPSVNYQFNF